MITEEKVPDIAAGALKFLLCRIMIFPHLQHP